MSKKRQNPSENKTLIGRAFEKLFKKLYSTDEIPNSGAGIWQKMDAENKRFLFSLKATKNNSYRITKDDLEELYLEANGPGGKGLSTIPAMGICFVEGNDPQPTDEILVVLPMDELVSLLKEKPEVFAATKKDEKYAKASVPSLLRDRE